MRHRLRTKNLIEHRRQLRPVLRQLGWIRESRVRQDVFATHGFKDRRHLVWSGHENEPGTVRRAIRIQSCICRIGSIVQAIEIRAT